MIAGREVSFDFFRFLYSFHLFLFLFSFLLFCSVLFGLYGGRECWTDEMIPMLFSFMYPGVVFSWMDWMDVLFMYGNDEEMQKQNT